MINDEGLAGQWQQQDANGAEQLLLRAVLEQAGVGLCLLDPENRIVIANGDWLRITGHQASQVLGKDFFGVYPERLDQPADLFARARAGETVPLPLRQYFVSGQEIWCRGTLSPIPMAGGPGVLISCRDATGMVRNHAEQARLLAELREANQRLVIANLREARTAAEARQKVNEWSMLLENLAEGVVVIDGVTQRVSLNQAGLAVLQLPAGHEVRAVEDLRQFVIQGADGRPLPFEGWPANRALRGERFAGEEIVLVRPGNRPCRLLVGGGAVQDPDGQVLLAINIFQDITTLRQMEEVREGVLSLISHDLRQPLTAILGMADWLRRSLLQHGLAQEAHSAEILAGGARRMNVMIQELVDSARLEHEHPEILKECTSLVALVSEAIEIMVPLEERGRLQVKAPKGMSGVPVDPERLQRVVANLITNALKYSPADSPVLVRLRQGSGEALLSVTDRGVGISEEDLPFVFDRFFRTKPGKRKSEGLGLGLYIARLIVQAHGGRIWAESELGKGSTFTIALPLG